MPVAGAIIGAVGAVGGGAMQANAAEDASQAQIQANRDAMQMQLAMFNTIRGDMMPSIQAGNIARQQLMAMLGLPVPIYSDQGGAGDGIQMEYGTRTREQESSIGNPEGFMQSLGGKYGDRATAGAWVHGPMDTLFEDPLLDSVFSDPRQEEKEVFLGFSGVGSEPEIVGYQQSSPQMGLDAFLNSTGYQFELGEGQKAVDRSAAARGGALSGRAIKEAQRYSQGLASTRVGDYLNRLAAMAGLGQTATSTAGGYGMQTAGNVGGLLQSSGAARGSGYINAGNAWGDALGSLGQIYGDYQQSQQYAQPSSGGGGSASDYTGSAYSDWASSTGYSDERLKTDIEPIGQDGQFVRFAWTWNKLGEIITGKKGRDQGYIAQQVEQIAPEFVIEAPDGFKQVDYAGISAALTQG